MIDSMDKLSVSLESMVTTMKDSKIGSKLDDILLKINPFQEQNSESRTIAQSLNPHEADSGGDSKAISPLLKSCRSIEEIVELTGCMVIQEIKIVCHTCTEYYKHRPSSENRKLSEASGKAGEFIYDFSLGMDFRSEKQLPREFRNLKGHIIRHIESADSVHADAVSWGRQQEAIKKELRSRNLTAGMTCGRLVYKIVKRGRPYSDYPGDILITAKNGGIVGDTNHSRMFPQNLLGSLYEEIKDIHKAYLTSPLPATEQPPPCSVLADKATSKRRCGQITGLSTVFPEFDDLIQALYIDNRIVSDHSGKGISAAIKSSLEVLLDAENIRTQLVSGGFDGQYFHNHVDEHLRTTLNLENRLHLGSCP